MKTKEGMADQSTYRWVYKYDRTHRVWRAFSISGVEINQYSKDEMFFIINHLDDSEAKEILVLTRITPLTERERENFLLEIADERTFYSW